MGACVEAKEQQQYAALVAAGEGCARAEVHAQCGGYVWGLWCRGRQSPSWVSLFAPLACLLHGDIRVQGQLKKILRRFNILLKDTSVEIKGLAMAEV